MASVQTQLEHLRASNSFKQFEEEFFNKWLDHVKTKIHDEEERRIRDLERVKGILKISWYHFLVLHICHQDGCIIPVVRKLGPLFSDHFEMSQKCWEGWNTECPQTGHTSLKKLALNAERFSMRIWLF